MLGVAVRWWQRVALLRMARIDILTLRALLEGKPPLVIDVRRGEHRAMDPYAIPGALLLRHGDAASQLAGIARNRKLVLRLSERSVRRARRVRTRCAWFR